MARNGSGTMSILNSFSANTTIESAKVNANFTDVASEITASLPRNGEAGMTGQLKSSDGTVGAPGITFASDLDCGFYRTGANTFAVAGTITNGTSKYDAFPSGTMILFMQTSAPTGWTKSTTHNDKALRIVSGTASSGGTTAFTSVFTSRTFSADQIPNHAHTFSGTTSTESADHTHTYLGVLAGGGGANLAAGSNFTANANVLTTSGISATHTHTYSGVTGNAGSGNPIDFAVQYVDVIAASKDA
jgi:hypothetical protein